MLWYCWKMLTILADYSISVASSISGETLLWLYYNNTAKHMVLLKLLYCTKKIIFWKLKKNFPKKKKKFILF